MAVTRVVVVSDSHLAQRTPESVSNWQAVVDHVAATGPDLVIHAGDVTADGTFEPDDLDVARRELGRLDRPLHTIPGNHDVGENPHAGLRDVPGRRDWLVTPERLDRYRAALGPDRWAVDLPGWRLVGINAQLLGSGLDDEADQWRWLDTVLAPPARRRVALVVHKPLIPTPALPGDATPGRYVPAEPGARLVELLRPLPGSLVVSGHCHQYAVHTTGGLTHLWAPTTWAVIPDRYQPTLGDKTCGLVELDLHDDGTIRTTFRQPRNLTHQTLIDDIPDPYAHHR
jgi:3',5'-cyclic AMP phosphodiesterase CpdA